jgi:hypothetical protein
MLVEYKADIISFNRTCSGHDIFETNGAHVINNNHSLTLHIVSEKNNVEI